MKKKHISFFAPYPLNESPSQRFRLEQYLSFLQSKGFEFTFLPFLNQSSSKFRSENPFFTKLFVLTKSILLRPFHLYQLISSEFVFIHREIAPLGPPILEWIISRVLNKKIIYDFDDAIWLTDKANESSFIKLVRWRRKVRSICKWSYKISCGNSYLADYAKQFNQNVFINPTTVDTGKVHISDSSKRGLNGNITIGWTGSHSTIKYLKIIISVLQAIEEKYPEVKFLVIADEDPKLPLKNMVFRLWKKETEIIDLASIDIGIMPLPDDAWTKGKCGFKALQYMAMEIPAVVSPVGVNSEIVEHGVDGYWCSNRTEWFTNLEELILNREKRIEMGKRGRKKVIGHYSVASNSANFLSLFQ